MIICTRLYFDSIMRDIRRRVSMTTDDLLQLAVSVQDVDMCRGDGQVAVMQQIAQLCEDPGSRPQARA
jgi:hypothetical protein